MTECLQLCCSLCNGSTCVQYYRRNHFPNSKMLSFRLRCRGGIEADRVLNHVGEPDQRAAAVCIGWVGLFGERYNLGVRGARLW